ncbi:hypothetical protein SAMN05660690_4498 [Geodermatophilus telluris]|uniref:Uncharacterized protein n=1 Tax=Geodermatophilus telluris TaxID=1190417 RepID=A0A1G6VL91_9ACTN|nr:hypothetical protein [Geodermatophilus telluris]SDD54390.1 hypothetical protein SAMN05660690_4498 [Geodermatophilus telluris]
MHEAAADRGLGDPADHRRRADGHRRGAEADRRDAEADRRGADRRETDDLESTEEAPGVLD